MGSKTSIMARIKSRFIDGIRFWDPLFIDGI